MAQSKPTSDGWIPDDVPSAEVASTGVAPAADDGWVPDGVIAVAPKKASATPKTVSKPKVNPFEDRDLLGELNKTFPGIGLTSGYRDKPYQADMRRRGYKPAENSEHLTGDSVDISSFPGMTLAEGAAQLRRQYPNARILYGDKNHRDHVHFSAPGYGAFPALGGAAEAGLSNPVYGKADDGWVPDDASAPTTPTNTPAPAAAAVEVAPKEVETGATPPTRTPTGFTDLEETQQQIIIGANRSSISRTLDALMRDPSKTADDVVNYLIEAGHPPSEKNIAGYKYWKARPNEVPPSAIELDQEGNKVDEGGLAIDVSTGVASGIGDARRAVNNYLTGAIGLAGLPVDAVQGTANLIPGVEIEGAVGGSEQLKGLAEDLGIINQGAELAPRTEGEELEQAIYTAIGENTIPAAALLRYGNALKASGMTLGNVASKGGNAGKQSLRKVALEAAERPVAALAVETAASVGQGIGEELTEDSENQFIRALGPVAGALIAGGAVGVPTFRGDKTPAPNHVYDTEPKPVIRMKPELSKVEPSPEEPLIPSATREAVPAEGREKYLGNINSEVLQLDDDLYKSLDEATAELRIDRESTDLVASKAKTLLENKSVDDILTADPKSSELQEYGVARRVVLKKALADQEEISERLLSVDPENMSKADLDDLMVARSQVAAAVEAASGQSKLAGRILNSQKIMLEDLNAGRALSKLPGEISPEDYAKLVVQHKDNPSALGKIAADSMKPSFFDRITSYWYNMILSGPWTHAYNIVSTGANVLTDVVESTAAASYGSFKKLIGAGSDRDLTWGEMGQRIQGLYEGSQQGIKNFGKAYSKGTPLDNVLRLDETKPVATSTLGKIFEAPSRLLAAEDEVFRSIASKSELRGLAHRKAYREGLRGKDLAARREELLASHNLDSDTLYREAERKGKELRFQEELGPFLDNLEKLRQIKHDDPNVTKAVKFGMRLIVPFVRTINGLLKTAGRRSPLGVFSKTVQKDLKAGGARRDKAISQIAIGTLSSYYALNLALEGKISGAGPTDYRERKELEASGWKPFSFLADGRWVSYRRMDPFSTSIGALATTAERWDELSDKEWDKRVMEATRSFVLQIMDKTPVSGVLEAASSAAGDNDGMASAYLANLGASFIVPNLVSQLKSTFGDDSRRVTKGDGGVVDRFTNTVKSRVPGLGGDLANQHDIFGRVINKPNTVTGEEADKDPVVQEVFRLREQVKGNIIGEPGYRVKNEETDEMVTLTPEQHEKYKQVSGTLIYDQLALEMARPGWSSLPDEEKLAIINEIKNDSRKEARETLFDDEAEVEGDTVGDGWVPDE